MADKEKETPKTFERHPKAASGGGYLIDDKKGLKDQRGVVWEFVKKIGQNLMNGADLQKTAFPVHINQPRSYLEMIIDGWVYAPIFLTKSAETSDPLERFKLVVAFVMSGLHNTCYLSKPFNPILGETYQAEFPDGTQVFCEQPSHHPPITAWEMIGPNNSYKMYGWGEWMASFRGNSVKGWQKGKLFVEYPDGGRISWSLSQVNVHGVLWGDRIIEYEGTTSFEDLTNGYTCDIITPTPTGGLFSGWFSKKLPSDYFVSEIKKDNKRVAKVEGNWMGAIEFDGKRYWTWTDAASKPEPVSDALTLASDARYREDIKLLKAGKADEAADAKVKLEELQRRDARLRKEAKAKK